MGKNSGQKKDISLTGINSLQKRIFFGRERIVIVDRKGYLYDGRIIVDRKGCFLDMKG
jgi:hypothetical protein